jgi:hypothetical protein
MKSARWQVAQIVSKIQRADYEGDQTALKKYYDELAPFLEDPQLASRVRYWRGFDKKTPDVNAAERNARGALAIVPYWHYVRDILLPQILAAKSKAN